MIRKPGTSSKRKRSRYSERLGAAASLIAAYGEFPECVREHFRRFLALYCEDGVHSSLPCSDDSGDAAGRYTTEEQSRVHLYERWIEWAQEIQGSSLTGYERREAVRVMLEALSRQKGGGWFMGPELRAVAKRTIGWTRWDTGDTSELRSVGCRTEADLEAWKAEFRARLRKRRRIVNEKERAHSKEAKAQRARIRQCDSVQGVVQSSRLRA